MRKSHCVGMTLCIFCRVITRATVIPFREPSISPNNEEEEDAFTELEELILSGELSRAVGWAIYNRGRFY